MGFITIWENICLVHFFLKHRSQADSRNPEIPKVRKIGSPNFPPKGSVLKIAAPRTKRLHPGAQMNQQKPLPKAKLPPPQKKIKQKISTRWFNPWPFYPVVGGHQQPLKGSLNHPKKVTFAELPGRWWFQRCFFVPTWGNSPIWLSIFFRSVGSTISMGWLNHLGVFFGKKHCQGCNFITFGSIRRPEKKSRRRLWYHMTPYDWWAVLGADRYI